MPSWFPAFLNRILDAHKPPRRRALELLHRVNTSPLVRAVGRAKTFRRRANGKGCRIWPTNPRNRLKAELRTAPAHHTNSLMGFAPIRQQILRTPRLVDELRHADRCPARGRSSPSGPWDESGSIWGPRPWRVDSPITCPIFSPAAGQRQRAQGAPVIAPGHLIDARRAAEFAGEHQQDLLATARAAARLRETSPRRDRAADRPS